MSFRKLLFALFLLCLAPMAKAVGTVTVTATSNSILGSSQTITMNVSLVDPNQTGVLRTGATVLTNFTAASTNGTTLSLGPIYGNDVITDGFGNASTSYYIIGVYTVSNSGIVASTPVLLQAYQFAGSGTFDLSSTLPYSLGAVSPAGSVLGQNLTFTGNNSFTGSNTFTFATLKSVTTNPAATGNIRLANADSFCWRNGSNSADLCLTVPFNALTYPGTFVANSFNGGSFQSNVINPAVTGVLQLAKNDTVCWRNAGNSADVCVSKNASDQIAAVNLNIGTGLFIPTLGVRPSTPASGQVQFYEDSNDNLAKYWPGGGGFTLPLHLPQVVFQLTQYTNSTTGFTGTNLSFPVNASENYTAVCHLYYQAAATGGLNIEFTGPAAPTVVIYGLNDPNAATTFNSSVATSYSTSLGQAISTANTNFDATVSFSLQNGVNAGTVALLAKSSAAAQLQIQAGSYCQVQ